MALSDLYITAIDLEEYFVDKDSGLPLAGGQIQFWVDGARTTPKLVYELTGDPTNSQGGGYDYAALPNPIILSDVGTIQDNNGNNVPVYYYPYDEDGNLQLYYVVVLNSAGVVQFTRQAWPNLTLSQVAGASETISDNQIMNPQFSLLNLAGGATTQTIPISTVGTTLYQIAAGWTLSVTITAGTAVTITRTSLAGSNNYPTNPPYWLTITPGANITSLILYQRFDTPGAWAQTLGNADGWVSASVTLAVGSALRMAYRPSNGSPVTLLTANNLTLAPATFNNTLQLPLSNNTNTPDNGYVEIDLVLPTAVPTTFSSVQLVSTNVDAGNIFYIQDSVERQQSYLFSNYLPGILGKPTRSYMIGWDFPLNPAQFGVSGTVTTNNSSQYTWDQTILYSSANAGVAYSRAPSGALRLTGAVAGSVAVIQYMTQAQARELLTEPFSIKVSALTSNGTAVPSTVSVFWTAGTALPNLNTGLSIVASLGANGNVLTVNNPTGGTWTAMGPGSGLGGGFSLGTSTSATPNEYDFTSWTLGVGAGATTATFVAVIVGFGNLPVGQVIDISSISVVPGVEATAPATQSLTEVLNDCRHYYWKTYERATAPGTATTLGMKSFPAQQTAPATPGSSWQFFPTSFYVSFPQQMRVPPLMTFYSIAGTLNYISFITGTTNSTPAGITSASIDTPPLASTYTFSQTWKPTFPVGAGTSTLTRDGVLYVLSVSIAVQTLAPTAGGMAEAFFGYHCVADARLGLV